MLTVVSKGHALIHFSSSSEAHKVIVLDFTKKRKTIGVFFGRNQPFCLEECCSNANRRMTSHCFSDVEADKIQNIAQNSCLLPVVGTSFAHKSDFSSNISQTVFVYNLMPEMSQEACTAPLQKFYILVTAEQL